MRSLLLIGVVMLGCGSPPRASPPAAVPAPPATMVLDGIVVWDTALAEAPPGVQARVRIAQLFLDTIATAPRPPMKYDEDPDGWYRAMGAVKAHTTDYDREVQAWLARPADEAAAMDPERARLFQTLVALVEEHGRARFLFEVGVTRPAFGSCTNSADESFGDALKDTREKANACVELSAGVTGPMSANVDECRRRAAWCQGLIETGIDGVCEPPPMPGR